MMTSQQLIDRFCQALEESWGYIWGTAGVRWDADRQARKVTYMQQHFGSGWKTTPAAKEDNCYYAALHGSKWIGRKVADCSGLFRWAFEQHGEKIAHGSNSIWRAHCSARGWLNSRGGRADGAELRPGTAVFTDRDGDKTHIGLYVGEGKVIEAADTISGVVTSAVTAAKWKCWGELSAVRYPDAAKQPEETEPETFPENRTLRRGNIGPDVTRLQNLLLERGYSVGPDGADGDFGRNTEAAVRAFQRDNGLAADGVAGPKTFEALLRDPGSTTYAVTVSGLDLTQARALVNNYPARSVMRAE